ncbi:hypothetical protein HMPREF9540_04590 [Escherichia coli MS 115-1]|nr:hypothetical protein HMPREF9540_04590 [Escherichia coli MS 115-1]
MPVFLSTSLKTGKLCLNSPCLAYAADDYTSGLDGISAALPIQRQYLPIKKV